MAKLSFYFAPILVSLCVIAAPQRSVAQNFEFVCEADVFYSWKASPKQPATKAIATVEEPKAVEIFYTKAGATGSTENDAKKSLTSVIEQVKADAMMECQTQHVDSGKCFARGLKTMGHNYQFADYATRHMLLEGVRNTCQEISGSCSGTRSSEVSCYENRPATIPAPAAEGAEDSKTDSGKDDKKKKK